MHTKDGQPETGSPKIMVLIIINIIVINEPIQKSIPKNAEIVSGIVEKDIIASNA